MDQEPTDLPGWIATGIVSIIAALTSAVAFLYRRSLTEREREMQTVQASHTVELTELKKDRDELKVEAHDCRRDREELRIKMTGLEIRLDMQEKKLDQP